MRTNPPHICDFSSVSCPCRIVDLEDDVLICDFVSTYATLDIAGDSRGIKMLLSKVCAEVKNERLQHESIVRRNKELERKFLDNVKIGDIVFCTAEIENVIFVEYPPHKYGHCKYKLIYGKIGEAPAFAFRIISKGKEHAKYETRDNEKAIYCARYAKRYGFRVEEHKVEDTYVIDIYGDKKENVEEFITNFENGLILNSLEDF